MFKGVSRGFKALIIGPPGSGKGYISKLIVEKFGVLHISTGDMLRQHIQDKTALGKKAKHYMSRGQLVPDELLHDIVVRGLDRAHNHNFLLDGYPRNVAQARQLDKEVKLDFVLHLDLEPRVILAMLKNRLVHPASGRVYNREGDSAPQVSGRDDLTGEYLVRRLDDKPHVILRRLQDYELQTHPVIRHYQKQFIAHTVHVRHHGALWNMVERYLNARWKRRFNRSFNPTRRINVVN